MYSDYKCTKCNEVKLVGKEYSFELNKYLDYPSTYICSCSGVMKRVYSVPVVSVAEGMHGNASNGYTSSNLTYNPSPYSPLNKVYGNYGRQAKVETEGE